ACLPTASSSPIAVMRPPAIATARACGCARSLVQTSPSRRIRSASCMSVPTDAAPVGGAARHAARTSASAQHTSIREAEGDVEAHLMGFETIAEIESQERDVDALQIKTHATAEAVVPVVVVKAGLRRAHVVGGAHLGQKVAKRPVGMIHPVRAVGQHH